jgi:multidrug efflux pump subunit AcrA (membrane-fusion protein)
MSPRPFLLSRRVAASVVALGLGGCPAGPTTEAPATPRAAGSPAGPADDTVVAMAATGATLQWPGRVVVGNARAVVSAPLSLRLKRLLVLPGDVVARGAAVAEVAIPEVAAAAATLRGARARRAVAQQRRDWLAALRKEGLPRVADELAADADLADLDAAIATSTALLRVVDVDIGDAALDELATRGTVTLRAPVAGSVVGVGDTAAGVVVGAVVAPGTVLATLSADGGAVDRVRVIVRLPVTTPTPTTATALLGPGLALKALPGQGPVDLQDGANDRTFALVVDDASRPLVAGLVDGQGLTVTLPLTASSSSGAADAAEASPARVPASAVRLGGDGVAEVAEVHTDGDVVARHVQVLGRVGSDLIVGGVPAGARLKRDARAALTVAGDGGGHDH